MIVFISWSGTRSQLVAEALHSWLPQVINEVKPFVSSNDIYAGARWQQDIAEQLERASFGILCVTSSNQHAPWLNFEAGALAKVVDASRVVPLAVDLKTSAIENPLAQFQALPIDRAGIKRLVATLNDACEDPLKDQHLQRAFERWWEELEASLAAAFDESETNDAERASPPDRDMLAEILDTVRGLSRQAAGSVSGPRTPLDADGRADLIRQIRELAPDAEVAFPKSGNRIIVRPGRTLDLDTKDAIRQLIWRNDHTTLITVSAETKALRAEDERE